MDSKDYTSQIQSRALRILRIFQNICDKHGLLYYAIGGTCIGAVRHHGFIPWDDDIDVAMPYPDYRKLIDVCKAELPKPYSIIGPKNCKHYTMIYMKIQDESTCFVEKTVKDYKDRYCGIYIDVFPLFGLPEDEQKREKIRDRNEQLKRLNIRLRFPFSNEDSIQGRLFWLLHAPSKMVHNYSYYTDLQEAELSRYPFDCSDKIFFPWRIKPEKNKRAPYKDVFFYEDFESGVDLQFEDGVIKVPVGYHRYLTMDFGDYMQLPPKDKQVCTHPSAIIDLERSYKDYI